ncbi:hypothetical protein [Streptomyces sp. NPDC058142]|uniref:hypothetical protein n=1 Tax=Streptomyces sp. NPDC058142 TaxID=3346355 RepID=UPI0036E0E067
MRTTPPPPPADPSADPVLATLRRVVDDLVANTYAIGELTLQAAPAHLSDRCQGGGSADRSGKKAPRPRSSAVHP